MRRTRGTVMALTAMGLLFVASACGDGSEGNDQAATDVDSATPAAHSEPATRQSAKSTAGGAADAGTTSTTAAESDDGDSSDSADTPETTSTTAPSTPTTRPSGEARPSDVCGDAGAPAPTSPHCGAAPRAPRPSASSWAPATSRSPCGGPRRRTSTST